MADLSEIRPYLIIDDRDLEEAASSSADSSCFLRVGGTVYACPPEEPAGIRVDVVVAQILAADCPTSSESLRTAAALERRFNPSGLFRKYGSDFTPIATNSSDLSAALQDQFGFLARSIIGNAASGDGETQDVRSIRDAVLQTSFNALARFMDAVINVDDLARRAEILATGRDLIAAIARSANLDKISELPRRRMSDHASAMREKRRSLDTARMKEQLQILGRLLERAPRRIRECASVKQKRKDFGRWLTSQRGAPTLTATTLSRRIKQLLPDPN